MESEYTGDHDGEGITTDIDAVRRMEYSKGFADGRQAGMAEGWDEAYAEGWGDMLQRLKIYHESGEKDVSKWIEELDRTKKQKEQS